MKLCCHFTSLKQRNIILSLNTYRTKTILTIREKDINKTTISSIIWRCFTHTKNQHPSSSFLRTSAGGTWRPVVELFCGNFFFRNGKAYFRYFSGATSKQLNRCYYPRRGQQHFIQCQLWRHRSEYYQDLLKL